jgi:uncharacterized protein (TIGR03084 family)
VAADLEGLLDDLTDETTDLDAMVTGVMVSVPPDEAWSSPTPAVGWTVRDQISHLWFFDREARRALEDPEGFSADLASISADPASYMAGHLAAGRDLGDGLLGEFTTERLRLIDVLRSTDPSRRIPWYGPPMSPMSFATARLMETWAHGQDIADAWQVRRTPTDRLRHICHLGVRTRDFSYAIRGEVPPERPVAVVLRAPSGAEWAFGPADSADRVEGPALDFCLVVTQRRHLGDVDLRVTGAAEDWLVKAQAFAGAPSLTDESRRGLAAGPT